ncbi:hypothetical protein RvY_15007 [Ramazzottius varieornatus]|uniref:FAS1 domain-containing protein n=1 Tax=Ramazzottius varieornatus TaxID=947166 RepID=A0A1D1VUR5_RAMVA|nr:hypothetical protein RvY_15007 [Ramazzottius varieornatus]
MIIMARSVFVVLSFLLALVAVHGAILDDTKTDPRNRPTLDIIETADRLGGAYGFLTALDETNLTDFVRNLRDVTVFIPSADAFRAMPEGARNYFRKHMDRYQELLKYHIVQGQFTADRLADEVVYATAASVHQVPFGARVNIYNHTAQANITTYQGAVVNSGRRDYLASNGIIHFLDEVVLHVAYQSTMELLNDTETSMMFDLIRKTPEALYLLNSTARVHTLFAPDNEAFGKLSNVTRSRLNKETDFRKRVLLNHITELGAYFSNGWVNGEKVPITNWTTYLTITKPKDRPIYINGNIEILVPDNSTANGVVHVIDTVILPVTDEDIQEP